MKKKLMVVVLILAIAMMTMPSFASTDSVGYSATVAIGQATSISILDSTFGTILRGGSVEIPNSFYLNNTGDIGATVDAKFTSNYSTTFGLVNGTNVIGASKFELKQNSSGSYVPLNDDGTNVFSITTVSAKSIKYYDVKLTIPNEAMAGTYSGDILLTFAEVPYT